MNTLAIEGFEYGLIPGADGVGINAAVGGDGPAMVLLHGFPQTHYMWRHVARQLAAEYTVIVPDLRGYGRSDKPSGIDPQTYSKRAMANDIVRVAARLGFDHFGLIGHDRGALVAVRAGLDHPEAVDYLGILDVLPTLDTWAVLQGVNAKVAWHLYLMAQPLGLPEKMISAVAPEFFASFLDAWDTDGSTFTAQERDYYIANSVPAVDSIVADYRATAGIDLEMEQADRARGAQLIMPVAVISQDWGSQLGFDAASLWTAWAPDLTYQATSAGHFMAEENPDEIATFIKTLAAQHRPAALTYRTTARGPPNAAGSSRCRRKMSHPNAALTPRHPAGRHPSSPGNPNPRRRERNDDLVLPFAPRVRDDMRSTRYLNVGNEPLTCRNFGGPCALTSAAQVGERHGRRPRPVTVAARQRRNLRHVSSLSCSSF